jgi:hypothetical protein
LRCPRPRRHWEGITFNSQLGQAIEARGRSFARGDKAEPCKSFGGPFHLGIDQQDRIWVTNAFSDFVTRFSAADPSKTETFKAGVSGSGLAIDSRGNVWVTNRLGSSARGADILKNGVEAVKRTGVYSDEFLVRAMSTQTSGENGGSVTLLQPDGSQAPGSPFTGPNLPGPWAAVVDGDDQVWISNFAAPWGRIAHLCGARTETCPPGMKTGDPISPPGGYVGGGLQMQVDIALDPAGNIWVGNNWQDINQCFDNTYVEALSTRCGGQGVVVFYGMAKPLRTPLIGPPRAP